MNHACFEPLRRAVRCGTSRRALVGLCLIGASLPSLGCAAAGAMKEAPGVAMPPPAQTVGLEGAAMDGTAHASAMPGSLSPSAPSLPGQAPSRAPTSSTKGLPTPTSSQGAKEVSGAKVDASAPDVEQMIVFTGRLDLMVAQTTFGATLGEVVELAAERGGYIHQQDDQSVTVRVPSSRFRETMKALEELGEVTHRSVQAQDVTEQHFDLGVRLKSLLATRDRLQRFLDRAKTIEEVLRVEQELRRLNAEIDKLEGQRRYLAAQAAYSTITVSLRPKPEEKVIAEDDDVAPPPPPPPKTLVLPIEWLGGMSLDRLLQLDED